MPSHLAITIGPIYQTMSLAKKTRELWSASFTFSRLMKHLITSFSAHGSLISPSLKVKEPLHGAGVYADRCFFQLNTGLLTKDQIESCKQNALASFSVETGISNAGGYYQIYVVQSASLSQPVKEMSQMLDVLELQQNYSPVQKLDWTKQWSDSKYFQELYKLGYDNADELLPDLLLKKGLSRKRFPSIVEISTNEFARRDEDRYWSAIGYQGILEKGQEKKFKRVINPDRDEEMDDDNQILTKVKEAFPDQFLFRHKYFSVVLADGDNVGALMAEIEKQGGSLPNFSDLLASYSAKAADVLVKYGAFPVYLGGDDLLFFAPLANNFNNDLFTIQSVAHGSIFGNNLFFLLSKLNEAFREELKPLIEKHKIPVSLSFGVMCGYYKQPLREILQSSYSNLFENAKSQPGKNYIAMQVQKHSGQSFQLGFKQEGELYESFLKMSQEAANKELPFLNSVMYKLDDQKMVLDLIGNDKSKLAAFFTNNFNEAVHDPYKKFFEATAALIYRVFIEYSNFSINDKIEKIYGALRFVHFINAKDVGE